MRIPNFEDEVVVALKQKLATSVPNLVVNVRIKSIVQAARLDIGATFEEFRCDSRYEVTPRQPAFEAVPTRRQADRTRPEPRLGRLERRQ